MAKRVRRVAPVLRHRIVQTGMRRHDVPRTALAHGQPVAGHYRYCSLLVADPSFLGGMASAFDLWGKLLQAPGEPAAGQHDALSLAADRRAILQDHLVVRMRLWRELTGHAHEQQTGPGI